MADRRGGGSRAKAFLKKYSGSFKYLGAIPNGELYKYYSQGSVSVLFFSIRWFWLRAFGGNGLRG